ncbi:MAG: tetratricopeptide repeat protein [Myxococcota bacterium]|nr:tetratricopeptide repeat protein [Myxococcota bacterium]
MYRLITAIMCSTLTACVVPNTELRDQPQIERLRIQISKARNAIAETRSAIAEARGAPHLPELYVRLGELLSDEARYHYQVAYERERGAGKSLNVPQVRFLKEQAVGVYKLVLRRYPKTKLADRVLFNMGQEYRELGKYKEMRDRLEQLAKDYPLSPLRPDALLILGDDQFDRNEMVKAGEYYQQIIDGPPGRMTGLGHFKLAWVFVNQAECKAALENFEKALIASENYFTKANAGQDVAGTQSDLDVRREALVDLVYCYTQERKPLTAVPFLKRYGYSRGAYVAALSRLANRFSTIDQAEGAALVGRELLLLAPDSPDRIEDARMLHGAVRKTKKFQEVGQDAELIARAFLRQVRKPTSAPETREKLLTELEALLRDLATRGQEAIKKTAKGSKDRAKVARQVALAYTVHVQTFPAHEQTTAMLQNLVDVLTDAGDDFNAGRRALQVADRLSKGPSKDDAWYDAVVNLQSTLARQSGRLARVVSRAGLRKAGAALVGIKTLPADRARKVKFAIAQTDYDEGRFRSAIDRLNALALEYPQTTEGDESVHLVLDSYRTINDYLGLIRAGHRFLKPANGVSQKVRNEISPIVKAAEQQQLDELALAAAGVDGGDVTGDLEKFAEAYKGQALGERALINALLAARAAGDSKTLYRLANEIQTKYPKSEQLPAIQSTVARTAASRFELDQAVKYFAMAAQASPGRKVTLLVAEGQLKEQLADTGGARNALQNALKAAKKPAAQNQAATALGELLEREGDHARIVQKLGPIEADAGPNTLAYLGMAQVRTGDRDNGEATLQKVIDNGAGATQEARARAFYGQAEVFFGVLASYQPEDDVESIQELITLLEVTEQSYLKAAREASPVYTAAAFGRLASVSQQTAKRLRAIKIPASVPKPAAEGIRQAFAKRAIRLEKQAQDAIAACAEQAWVHHIFHPAVRICLKGEIPSTDPVTFDKLKPRTPPAADSSLNAMRIRLSKNPEDLDALRGLGEAFLKVGDAHTARLVFARAGQAGGGPLEANLLGIACLKAGDTAGALEGFARAAAGGLEAGRQNLASALRKLGMGTAAKTALEKFKSGRPGGRLLSGGEG